MTSIKKFLKGNQYGKYADLIDQVEAEMVAAGSKQRRNWWDILAGGTDGRPLTVNGHQFPVLRAAQIRKGTPVTPNAICLNEDEEIPGFRKPAERPKRRRLPRKANAVRSKGAKAHHAQAG